MSGAIGDPARIHFAIAQPDDVSEMIDLLARTFAANDPPAIALRLTEADFSGALGARLHEGGLHDHRAGVVWRLSVERLCTIRLDRRRFGGPMKMERELHETGNQMLAADSTS